MRCSSAVAGADDAVEPRLFKPDGGEIILLLLRRQQRDLAFDVRRDDDRPRAFFGRARLHLLRKGIALVGRGFLDIADIEDGLGDQEAEHVERPCAPPA